MIINFHPEFYLFTLWTRKALFWTLFIQMFLNHIYRKLLSLRTPIGTKLKSSFTVFLQMKIKLIIFNNLLATLALIGTSKFQLIKHFFIQFMNLSRCWRILLSTCFIITSHAKLISTFIANNVLTTLAFNRSNNDIVTFWAY